MMRSIDVCSGRCSQARHDLLPVACPPRAVQKNVKTCSLTHVLYRRPAIPRISDIVYIKPVKGSSRESFGCMDWGGAPHPRAITYCLRAISSSRRMVGACTESSSTGPEWLQILLHVHQRTVFVLTASRAGTAGCHRSTSGLFHRPPDYPWCQSRWSRC